jgi:riboflavin synthase
MFTGIITAVGRITTASAFGDGMRLTIETPAGYLDDVAIGDSIAIQGACMTATQIQGNQFTLDISRESLNKTIGLDLQAPVNLEKALRLSDRLGGHLVSGHVDGIGQIERFAAVDQSPDGSWHLVIQAPAEIAPFVAYKGIDCGEWCFTYRERYKQNQCRWLYHRNQYHPAHHATHHIRSAQGR